MAKQTYLRKPVGIKGQSAKLWQALKPEVEDTAANAIALKVICELFAKWEKFRESEAPQKYYLGLSSLKQANAMAKDLGLWKKEQKQDEKINPFEEYLNKRGGKVGNN